MKWLVTGFEPFAQARTNSSQIVVQKLAREEWRGEVKFADQVPVTFSGAWPFVRGELARDPSLGGVVAFGQAESRSRISLERAALNRMDARIADNEGARPEDIPVAQGPDLLWSSIPWEKFPPRAPFERSYSAGTFVCNALMYQIIQWAKSTGKMAGFVHFPLLKSQSDAAFDGLFKMDDEIAFEAARELLRFLVQL